MVASVRMTMMRMKGNGGSGVAGSEVSGGVGLNSRSPLYLATVRCWSVESVYPVLAARHRMQTHSDSIALVYDLVFLRNTLQVPPSSSVDGSCSRTCSAAKTTPILSTLAFWLKTGV